MNTKTERKSPRVQARGREFRAIIPGFAGLVYDVVFKIREKIVAVVGVNFENDGL